MLVATVDSYWLIMGLLILAVSLICFISAGPLQLRLFSVRIYHHHSGRRCQITILLRAC